ncbi:MAG: hypothetical protein CMQ53_03700 [Gammaproteobacteria bacterium]|nr:hypothetical protein [Gammaproteobacteria bacterium]
MEISQIIFLYLIIFTYICGKIYILAWKKYASISITPSGFGIFLPIVIFISIINTFGFFSDAVLSFTAIIIGGIFYLFDDLRELPPWTRIFLSFIFGFILFLMANLNSNFVISSIFPSAIFFGIISIFITNAINFNDGADLNIATIIFLTGVVLIFFSDHSSLIIKNIGWTITAFSIGFGILNRTPSTLYIGDSGCFVLSLLFLYFSIEFLLEVNTVPVELMSVLALPFFDVFYVMLIRIYYKHDMLSRNYLHLYQRIKIVHGGFFHLIPQILCMTAIIFLSDLTIFLGFDKFWTLLFLSLIFTPIFYLLCRFLFIENEYFFGDGKKNES